MTKLQKLTGELQGLCPHLDGWRVRARYIADSSWRHGANRAVVTLRDLADRTAEICVRRNWKTYTHGKVAAPQYPLPELIAHELGHIVVWDAIERLPETASRDLLDEVLASRVGQILTRMQDGRSKCRKS